MGKRLLVVVIALVIVFLIFVKFSGPGSAKDDSSVSIWKQMKRRLLDDDVPQEKQRPPRQFDMTNI